MHPVFHVSLLKKCVSPHATSQPLPTTLTEEWELQVQPAEILATRLNSAGFEEVLVKWVNLPDFENSWELRSSFQKEFPNFHLKDKMDLQGGGIVTDPKFGKVYTRKKNKVSGLTQAH